MAVANEAEGWAEAQRRIAACRETHSESLDLSELGLTRALEELTELDWLQQLDLSGNHIGAEGAQALSGLVNASACPMKGVFVNAHRRLCSAA